MNDCARLPLELDVGGEVVLHAAPDLAAELGPLVQALLAEGFDARVVKDPHAFEAAIRDADAPALHVVCRRGDELDLGALQSRARELSDVGHVWIDGNLATGGPRRLLAPIVRAAGDLDLRSRESIVERVDVDEVSNVVLLPVQPVVAAPEKRRRPRWHLSAAGVLAGAIAIAAVLVATDEAPIASPQTILPAARPRVVTLDVQRSRVIAAARSPEPAAIVFEPLLTEAPLVEPVPAPDDPVQRAVASGRAQVAAGLVVSPPIPTGIDWFHAAGACRIRRFWEASGWSLPTRTQLVALARARALPDALLWSRNKADRAGEHAVAVGGRSGLGRALAKSSTEAAIVCVKAWPSEE